MALVACGECGHQISTKAVACPQCGHPQETSPAAPQPKCHRCSEAATARCQHCGKLCCVVHLLPIYVKRGKRGTNELRCATCKNEAAESNRTHGAIGYFVLIVWVALAVFILAMAR